MAGIKETVLYYEPVKGKDTGKMKGVLVRLGIRIKNIQPDQVGQKVGYLAGLPGYEERTESLDPLPVISEKMLVMKNFTGSRMELLLKELKRAGVPKIDLKAVITESNRDWTFYELYEEIRKEHQQMHGQAEEQQ